MDRAVQESGRETSGRERSEERDRDPTRPISWPISTRLMALTILGVMTAEILIFVPSVAHFRTEWLEKHVEMAGVAGLATIGTAPEEGQPMSPAEEAAVLAVLDADLVALIGPETSRLVARGESVPTPDIEIDLGTLGAPRAILGAFDTLFFGGERTIRLNGPVGDGSVQAEMVISEAPLRRAMLIYSRNIFLLSLAIASFVAILIFTAIRRMLIRPIEAMTRSMISFAENPADPGRVIRPGKRTDEIGIAERELAVMQRRLSGTLREQRHLADLGLAVSKINHDLRNILASAQMISDQLSDLADPRMQRFAPVLIRSLDRALTYTQSVLAYGRAVESAPERRRVRLQELVRDVEEMTGLAPGSGIEFVNAVPEGFELDVDPGQFHRVLLNLCRNAVQALEGIDGAEGAVVRRVTVAAAAPQPGTALVVVEDTGPGLPDRARENLFQAFKGATRAGGTGLGLAIAAEIVEGHGGTIRLAEGTSAGARFEIRLPSRTASEARPSPANDAP